ncbi:MAG TPA: porin family protein [Cyclobacteriaceae bacterium]|nr:porin family protein [Cyclobacteriaceae bacterium]
MRKLMVVVCALFLLPIGASAQIKMEVGGKVGLNQSGLGLSSDGKLAGAVYNGRTSFHLGAYGLVRKGKFGLQPEIVYSRQGQTYTTPNYTGLRTNLNYINIPVVFKYYPTGGLSLQIGPQLGLLVGAKGDIVQILNSTQGTSLGQASYNQDLKRYLNSIDFSIAFGAGIDLPLGLNFTFRYNYGVSNINKYPGGSNESPSFSVANTQNQVLQFSVSKKFYKIGK